VKLCQFINLSAESNAGLYEFYPTYFKALSFNFEYAVCYDIISEPFNFKKEAAKDCKHGFGDLIKF